MVHQETVTPFLDCLTKRRYSSVKTINSDLPLVWILLLISMKLQSKNKQTVKQTEIWSISIIDYQSLVRKKT